MKRLMFAILTVLALAGQAQAHAIQQAMLMGQSAPASYRYWRILATNQTWLTIAGTYYQAIYEVGFYSAINATGTNLNIGSTASASSVFSGSYLASAANDGNTSTYWSTANASSTPQYWGVDLGSTYPVHSVILTPYLNSGTTPIIAQSYVLQYCTDNTYTSCTTQSSFSTANSSAATQTFTGL